MPNELQTESNWWARQCGPRDVLAIALPLIVSTASWAIMNFVDRMFLLWYSPPAMAAAMPSGLLHFTIMCFPLGVASYTNTFVAQYIGAGRHDRIGRLMGQSLYIGLITMPMFLLTIPLASWIFTIAGHSPELADLESTYYMVLAFGAGATIMAASLSSFFTGRGVTKVVMVVDIGASLLNVGLDYLLIFGIGGLPSLGIVGAGLATVTSQWARVVAYWLLMQTPQNRKTYQLRTVRQFDWKILRQLLRYGGPNGLQMLIEISAFTILILIVGQLGEMEMAATTLAFNINTVAFIPMLGMGIALATIVGQQLGRNRPDLATRATWTSLVLSIAYMGGMAILYLTVPDLIMIGHSSGISDSNDFLMIKSTTKILLQFVAVYSLFDALYIVFVSVLRGAGDTRFILITSMVITPLPVIAAGLGIKYADWGLYWCWTVITAWILSLGLVFSARFFGGKWRRMRVIEPDLFPGGKKIMPGPVATLHETEFPL